MSLLLLFARRRAKTNVGHAEFAVTEAQGRGRIDLSALAAALQPKTRVIRGHGCAAFRATEAYGHGRLVEEDLVAMLLSAA